MKHIIIVLLLLMITFIAGAQSLDRQIRNLAVEITRGYMEGIEDLLIKPRIGIGEFSEENEGAVKNSVGALASVLLTNEFSRSTVFSVIERKDLEAIMKEYSLSLSELTSEETAPELGELQGVELLLLGSVSEAGGTYIIAARLVEVEKGKIVV
jgi:curli biogenesis system outer membrane secretion channel CsgG